VRALAHIDGNAPENKCFPGSQRLEIIVVILIAFEIVITFYEIYIRNGH